MTYRNKAHNRHCATGDEGTFNKSWNAEGQNLTKMSE